MNIYNIGPSTHFFMWIDSLRLDWLIFLQKGLDPSGAGMVGCMYGVARLIVRVSGPLS